MNFSLLIPAAIDKPEYDEKCPYLFDGNAAVLPILKGLQGIDLDRFSDIYIVILQKYDEKYHFSEKLRLGSTALAYTGKFHIIILDKTTHSQTETVYEALIRANITGGLMIKDADSFFSCDLLQSNSVAIYPLDALTRVNPQNKSYVTLDDFFNITNIIEKKIIGRYFCTGGYCFEDADIYLKQYEKLKFYGPFYMSFLIFSMLLEGVIFRPVFVTDYEDWGTAEDWAYFN